MLHIVLSCLSSAVMTGITVGIVMYKVYIKEIRRLKNRIIEIDQDAQKLYNKYLDCQKELKKYKQKDEGLIIQEMADKLIDLKWFPYDRAITAAYVLKEKGLKIVVDPDAVSNRDNKND